MAALRLNNQELAVANARLLAQVERLSTEIASMSHMAATLAAARRAREEEQARGMARLQAALRQAELEKRAAHAEVAAKQEIIKYLEVKLSETQDHLAARAAQRPRQADNAAAAAADSCGQQDSFAVAGTSAESSAEATATATSSVGGGDGFAVRCLRLSPASGANPGASTGAAGSHAPPQLAGVLRIPLGLLGDSTRLRAPCPADLQAPLPGGGTWGSQGGGEQEDSWQDGTLVAPNSGCSNGEVSSMDKENRPVQPHSDYSPAAAAKLAGKGAGVPRQTAMPEAAERACEAGEDWGNSSSPEPADPAEPGEAAKVTPR